MMIKNSFVQSEILTQTGVVNEKVFFIIYGEVYVIKRLNIKNSEKEVII